MQSTQQLKFVRKGDVSSKIQNLYDEFIRLVFRVFMLEKDRSEKVELLKEKYSEICGQAIERNEVFIDRLKKVKIGIDAEKSSIGQYFIQVVKLLRDADIIDSSTFEELAPGDSKNQEYDPPNYAQRRRELAKDKNFINLLLGQKMGQQQRIAKTEKVGEILEKLAKIDYSPLDPNKELKVEFEHYGSSENGLGLLSSDFDISLTTLKVVDERKLLDHFAKEIRPILDKLVGKDSYFIDKVTHEKTRIPVINLNIKTGGGIFINFTVNNILGVYNSKLLKAYAEFDPRCHSLCLLVKIWAKVHKIVSVQRGFLSSYALSLMVISFLQSMKNPILPSLQKESKKDEIIEVSRKVNYDNIEIFPTNVKFETDPQIIHTLKKQYSGNEITDIQLLKEFFAFYSQYENFNKTKLSIKEGKREPRYKEEGLLYSIQDPFDIHHNPGSSLKKDSSQAQEFLDRMKKSHQLLEEGRFKEVFQFFTL